MKKVLIMAMLFTGMVSPSFAQEQQKPTQQQEKQLSPEELATKHTEKMTTELTLTEEQKTKFYAADLAHINKVRPLREKLKGSTTPEERKTIHAQIRKEEEAFDNEVKGFLSAEQQEKWKVVKERIKENRMQRKVNKIDDSRPVKN